MEQSPEVGELAAAIAAVMGSFRGVEKSGVNTFHRYKYASDADLLWTLKPALAANGLAVILLDFTIVREAEVKTKNGAAERLVDLAVRYRLAHKSGQWITISAPGSGQDPGDKALYKAMTGAFKYALRQTFAVPTGDDPEAHDDRGPSTMRPVGSASPGLDLAPTVAAFQSLDPSWTAERLADSLGLRSPEEIGVVHREKLKAIYKAAQAAKEST